MYAYIHRPSPYRLAVGTVAWPVERLRHQPAAAFGELALCGAGAERPGGRAVGRLTDE